MTITKIHNDSIMNPVLRKTKKTEDTMKGVLLNRYIQKNFQEGFSDFDVVSDSFLIPEVIPEEKQEEENNKSPFDYKKTLKPVFFGAGAVLAAAVGISTVVASYSKKCANDSSIVHPPDLATNINILEEPHFALYRALIKPTGRNIFGFLGVCSFSGVTLAAKTFVDGAQEVWVRKQKCDIEQDFQKDMVNVEKDAFVGKLNVVNKIMKNTSDYFKDEFSEKKENAFKGFINFKGKEDKDKKDDKNKKQDIKTLAFMGVTLAAIFGIGALTFKNYKSSAKNLETYLKKCEDTEIRTNIEKALGQEDKDVAIKQLSNVMKGIRATASTIKENFSRIKGITPEEINKATKDILSTQIYTEAPEALGGVSNKIQYYCYINEERGHLYNWILHPENPFNKYLFLGFCLISSTSYVAKKIADAIKEVTVERESKKSELELKKNLVKVEVDNFRVKKEAAINPLVDAFKLQKKNGKSKDELKSSAQDILLEIKNGPPYVYS